MERDAQYIAKGHSGRESPIKTNMSIEIANPNRYDRHDMMCDVIFYNYFDSIGSKSYCAYEIAGDCMFFKFFDTYDNDIHRYKMFSRTCKKDNFRVGKPVAINVYNNQNIFKFVSKFKYPVYYNVRTDEYHIDLNDCIRPNLFDATKKSHNLNSEDNDMVRAVEIDGVKLSNLIKRAGYTNKDISVGCGREANYITTALRNNRLDPAIIKLIETLYNIPEELYKVTEVEKVEQSSLTEPVSFSFTEDIKNSLHDIIYSAVYEAVKKAWSE